MENAKSVKSLGVLGANASVYKVTLPSKIVILKTTVMRSNDNLSYEHEAGMWVNTLHNDLFARTFGFYSARVNLRNHVNLDFVRRLKPVHTHSEQCEPNENKFLAVEYFDGIGADELIYNNVDQFVAHLPRALFQVYTELSKLKKQFTHYDLHLGNVMYDENFNPKIIDFGRCHFPGATDVERRVCTVCPVCGLENGTWFQANGKPASKKNDYYVNPAAPNQSHDLLYLFKLKEKYGDVIRNLNPALAGLLDKVVYEMPSGTPVLASDGVHICNVTDAAKELGRILQSTNAVQKKERVSFSLMPQVPSKRVYVRGRRSTRSSAGRTPARRAKTRRR